MKISAKAETVEVTAMGQVVIPPEIRRKFALNEGTKALKPIQRVQ